MLRHGPGRRGPAFGSAPTGGPHSAKLLPIVLHSPGSTIMSKRDVYVAKMKLQLDELNLKMTELSEQAKDVKQEAREKFDAEIVRLRADAQAAGTKLDEMVQATEDGWHKMVSEMERLSDAFKHSFAYFKSQI
jgi:hypothetical protein